MLVLAGGGLIFFRVAGKGPCFAFVQSTVVKIEMFLLLLSLHRVKAFSALNTSMLARKLEVP